MATTGGLFFTILLGVLLLSTMYCDAFPTTFELKKMDSTKEHSELIARDRARHQHIFQKSSMQHHGIVNFSVKGSDDLNKFGFYFASVKLGNPPKEYHLLIDTGSALTWVSCNPCSGCPNTSTAVSLSVFDPRNSSSAETISFTSSICMSLPYFASSSDPRCSYNITYVDGTEASGYYVRDTFHFDTFMGNNATASTTSTDVVFGCTNHQSGSLTGPNAVDGILGLGPRDSIISQLDSRGIMPSVFSHCLNGEGKGGGGILVLGEIIDPKIIYSPLVPKQTLYYLNLLSISIRGKIVPIDPIVFSTSMDRGTIVDSGSSYAYLPEEAYHSFIAALDDVFPPSMRSFPRNGGYCFQVSNSVRDVFPLVSLNFEGDASMVLKPEEYLLQDRNDFAQWCVGFQKSQGETILGDLVLKDKIIVYDLALQRIGWADYDCSLSVNISFAPSCSSRDATLHQFLTGLFYIILIFVGLLFV